VGADRSGATNAYSTRCADRQPISQKSASSRVASLKTATVCRPEGRSYGLSFMSMANQSVKSLPLTCTYGSVLSHHRPNLRGLRYRLGRAGARSSSDFTQLGRKALLYGGPIAIEVVNNINFGTPRRAPRIWLFSSTHSTRAH
jgi:hypothetical protein